MCTLPLYNNNIMTRRSLSFCVLKQRQKVSTWTPLMFVYVASVRIRESLYLYDDAPPSQWTSLKHFNIAQYSASSSLSLSFQVR